MRLAFACLSSGVRRYGVLVAGSLSSAFALSLALLCPMTASPAVLLLGFSAMVVGEELRPLAFRVGFRVSTARLDRGLRRWFRLGAVRFRQLAADPLAG